MTNIYNRNVYNSQNHGKVVINVFQSLPWSTWFSTWATMQSLESKQCGILFDKICERDGNSVKVADDAYVSRAYARGLNIKDAGIYKAWLLEKMGDADCLVYRPSTGSIAILNATGDWETIRDEVELTGASAE